MLFCPATCVDFKNSFHIIIGAFFYLVWVLCWAVNPGKNTKLIYNAMILVTIPQENAWIATPYDELTHSEKTHLARQNQSAFCKGMQRPSIRDFLKAWAAANLSSGYASWMLVVWAQNARIFTFMHRVHSELKTQTQSDPLKIVAARLANEARVICFDEFFVSDITDAMILGTLMENYLLRYCFGGDIQYRSGWPVSQRCKGHATRHRFNQQNTRIVNVDSGVIIVCAPYNKPRFIIIR